ncbi:helix-turn-helix domain-containing protein [Anaeromassilibacillus senegalensis]|uniref:helix-turn-helix domain-containing protein n=1 Tax=Anaeromassilibacillus senegalensis TaxID=1673717 RepID=UPI00068039E9|nr:helix-turn-helix transcriptional regulator [Anaeromassilibacillus senegalensis]
MNFLEKLDNLIAEKGINKSVLSKESGIPYTTIDAFYKKGYQNAKLPTIQKLCEYFDVTLDYLVRDDVNDYHYGKQEKYDPNYIKQNRAYSIDINDEIGKKKSPAPEEPEAEDEGRDELGIPRQAYDLFYRFLVERGYVLKGDDVTAVQADFFAGLVQMVNAAFPARPVQVQKDKAV